ncbi:hypothetical protein ACET9I_00405 [Aeromonas veronii]|uniref:hypothetical protein n=1 Tax=Aeromonas veronii TaxID=654 RepID=UPI001FD6A8C5|nr:hypothetical protein [Aeromonas veronii]MCJ8234279.1 hypothetical protein [Aeromonas veronii]
MVRYTGPPADRQRGGQPPTKHLSDQNGKGCDKNLQATENKGLIRKINVLNAPLDKGDDGLGSVIDTTKVTSSTPADQSQPQPYNGAVQRSLQPGSAAPNRTSGATKSGEKSHTKGQNWAARHAKAAWGDGKLFGFAIALASHHQAKPNKNEPIID